jgi:hypothetical protein
MKPEKVLLPLDIRECPLEIFSLVEGLARLRKRPSDIYKFFTRFDSYLITTLSFRVGLSSQ